MAEQTAYIWGKEKISQKRVKYQSHDPEGPKPFPHPSSQAGGRKWSREGVEAHDC